MSNGSPRFSSLSLYCRNYVGIVRLGLPILVSQLGMIVVGFADNSMVGHYSTDALASASFVNNVFNIAILMCIGFTYGLTPLIGALFATHSNRQIGLTLRNGIRLNLMFSLVVTAVMGVVYLNLSRLGQPEHLLPLIRPYFLIYLAGVVPVAIFQTFAQWAYAVNSTKMPMWIVLIANVVNILGNYLLIYGHLGLPELGLTGAGISTLIARLICPLAIFAVFMRVGRYRPYHAGFFNAATDRALIRKIFRTSIPISLQMGLETGAFSVAAMMAGWIGHIELASFQIIVIVGSLGFCIYYSIGAAVSVLVANASGTGNRRGMRQMAFAGYHIILFLACASSSVFLLFGRSLISVFTEDPEVVAMTMTLLLPLVIYQICDATQICFSSSLRGTGNVMPMLWIAFVSYAVVGIPTTYLFGFTFNWHLFGIVLSFSVSLFVAAVMFLYFFIKTTSKSLQDHGIDQTSV